MAYTSLSKLEQSQNRHDRIAGASRVFARAWVAHPLRVGAIAPSSRRLARLITSEISPHSAPVLELGPGTGIFTRALLGRGLRQEELILVECDPFFARLLKRDYPNTRIYQEAVERLRHINLLGKEQAGAVISGLPLLSMSMRSRIAILQFAFRHLRPGGCYYQFTYGLRCPVPRAALERLELKAVRMGSTLINAPPATVYRIRARRRTL